MARRTFEFLISASTKGWRQIGNAQRGLAAFNREVKLSNTLLTDAKAQIAGFIGAYAGVETIRRAAVILKEAETASFSLSSSLKAANREFENIGSMAEWEKMLHSLAKQLKIYSQSELKEAASRTVDMTKRLGLEKEQMKEVIARSADLAAGKTDLAGAVERVTAALRGEAEASEYLGLTLNETYVKSWYEARGAIQGAWKDLTDLEKAQIRYQVFLEQSSGLQGKAAESIHTIAGAWQFLTSRLNDSISNNKDLAASLQELAAILTDNAGGIGDFAASLVKGAGSVLQFVLNNKKAILSTGELVLKLYLAAKAFQLLQLPIRGVNAAIVAMTGGNIIGWLQKIILGMRVLAAGVIASTGPWGGLAVAVAAAGAAIAKVISLHLEYRQLQKDIAGLEEHNAAIKDKLLEKLKRIGRETGVVINSMADWRQAIKDQAIVYDNASGKWVKAYTNTAAAGKNAASTIKEATGTALAEMETQYRKYAAEVKRLQEEISGREQSLAEQLRELARSGMSDYSAWKDMKKQAEEYQQAAEQAMSSGDFAGAIKSADKAREYYSRLNREVKHGDRVLVSQQQALKTAMRGVERAGKLGISALKALQQQASNNADELIKKAGFADLSKGMNTLERQWFQNWQKMQNQAVRQLETVERKLTALVNKKRIVELTVRQKVEKALGGIVPGFAFGGSPLTHFPRLSSPYISRGSGVKDDVPAMLKRNEFVQPPWAVKYYGLRFMENIRRKRFPLALARAFANGGSPEVNGSFALSRQAPSFSSSAAAATYNITINTAATNDPRRLAEMVINELKRLNRSASR